MSKLNKSTRKKIYELSQKLLKVRSKCHNQQNWKFLIKKEIITEFDDPGRSASSSVTELINSG